MAVSADSDNSLPKRLLEVLRSARETFATDRHVLNNDLVQQAKDAGLHVGRCKCSKQAFDRLLARVDCVDGVIVAKISRKVVPAREDWPAIVAAHHVDDDGHHRSPQRTLQAVSIRSILSIVVFQCSSTERHVFCCRFLKRTPLESVSLDSRWRPLQVPSRGAVRTGHVLKAFLSLLLRAKEQAGQPAQPLQRQLRCTSSWLCLKVLPGHGWCFRVLWK